MEKTQQMREPLLSDRYRPRKKHYIRLVGVLLALSLILIIGGKLLFAELDKQTDTEEVWNEYRDEDFRFSLQYPSSLEQQDISEDFLIMERVLLFTSPTRTNEIGLEVVVTVEKSFPTPLSPDDLLKNFEAGLRGAGAELQVNRSGTVPKGDALGLDVSYSYPSDFPEEGTIEAESLLIQNGEYIITVNSRWPESEALGPEIARQVISRFRVF